MSWPNDDVLVQAEVDAVPTRIVRMGPDDCLVYVMGEDGKWTAADDEHASRAYVVAMLNAYGTVEPVDHARAEFPLRGGAVTASVREHPRDGIGIALEHGGFTSWRAFTDTEMVSIREAIGKKVRLEADRLRFRMNGADPHAGGPGGTGPTSSYVKSILEALARLVP